MLMPRRDQEGEFRVQVARVLIPLACLALATCARDKKVQLELDKPPAPRIEYVKHNREGGANPGQEVEITLKGDPDLAASASLGAVGRDIRLKEDATEKGLYQAKVRIPDTAVAAGQTATFDLVGRLEASSSNYAEMRGGALRVTREKVPESTKTITAEDLNLKRVLRPIYFDFDRYDLRSDALETLASNVQSLREFLRQNALLRIVVEGHCDERGTNEYNMALGDKRAHAGRDWLVNAGIAPETIRTISYGEERPAALGHDEGSWSKNRRAEFLWED
jgi:peptidoglycan-associated lipoprotein